MKIERAQDPHELNRILNDPDIYPLIKGWQIGRLDATIPLSNPANVALIGEGGALFFVCLSPPFYEVHTSILKSHRGAWAVEFVQLCLHWIFTRTKAMEILTRCPTLAAKALARSVGGTKLFTNSKGWIIDNDPVPADIYSLTVQNWIPNAPGLEARGKWFHDRLNEKLREQERPEETHAPDSTHDRYVGFAVDCAFGGQIAKSAILYNRYAALADYGQIKVVSVDPPVLDIGTASLQIGDQDFWVLKCLSEQSQAEPSSEE